MKTWDLGTGREVGEEEEWMGRAVAGWGSGRCSRGGHPGEDGGRAPRCAACGALPAASPRLSERLHCMLTRARFLLALSHLFNLQKQRAGVSVSFHTHRWDVGQGDEP